MAQPGRQGRLELGHFAVGEVRAAGTGVQAHPGPGDAPAGAAPGAGGEGAALRERAQGPADRRGDAARAGR
ncbi:hypothetical protein EF912_37535, partial [Streptomyces sp. WAC07061]